MFESWMGLSFEPTTCKLKANVQKVDHNLEKKNQNAHLYVPT